MNRATWSWNWTALPCRLLEWFGLGQAKNNDNVGVIIYANNSCNNHFRCACVCLISALHMGLVP
jgi:hypothetical protein